MASQTSNLSRKELAIKDLLAEIARALVDHPEGVQVRAVEGSHVTVLELKTHPEDLGKVIGREGRIAKSDSHAIGRSRNEIAQAIHT